MMDINDRGCCSRCCRSRRSSASSSGPGRVATRRGSTKAPTCPVRRRVRPATTRHASDFISRLVRHSVAGCRSCPCACLAADLRQPARGDGRRQHTGHVWDGDLRSEQSAAALVDDPVHRHGHFRRPVPCPIRGSGPSPGELGWSQVAASTMPKSEGTGRGRTAVVRQLRRHERSGAGGGPKAHAIGERLFVNNCAACHGSDAAAARAFPT